ncbi:hypothetical protein DESPIGER_0547 [Desulfovibrio piger]|uniref:Uncharacterized protein n=1 Tax=Desulfovibrio piger TaxID=901 RepID=A0A1K1LCJ9_9BACT|nr:hypothetical protein DESPIGER_0547 [Desulfovibrio piger]
MPDRICRGQNVDGPGGRLRGQAQQREEGQDQEACSRSRAVPGCECVHRINPKMIFKKPSKELSCLSTTDLPASPAGIMLAGRHLGKAFCGRQWQEGTWYGSPVSFWRGGVPGAWAGTRACCVWAGRGPRPCWNGAWPYCGRCARRSGYRAGQGRRLPASVACRTYCRFPAPSAVSMRRWSVPVRGGFRRCWCFRATCRSCIRRCCGGW